MNEVLNAILPHIFQLVGILVGFAISFITLKIKNYLDNKMKNETIKVIINNTVKCVEQVYKDIHGKEKLEKAKELVLKQLNNKGIKITNEEIEILIESAVNTMNNKK